MRLEDLAKRETEKKQHDAQDNRKRFPQAAQFKDAAERVFGKCKLVWARNAQTGEQIGVDAEPWAPWPDFGKYGDPRQTVSDDSGLANVRIRTPAKGQVPRNGVAKRR